MQTIKGGEMKKGTCQGQDTVSCQVMLWCRQPGDMLEEPAVAESGV